MEELLSFLPSPQIACGTFHTGVVTTNGRLYTCGDYHFGQLGRTNNPYVLESAPISDIIGFVSAGNTYTIVITIEGQLFVCGNNHYGQLGTGDKVKRSQLTLIDLDVPVKFVSAGIAHTALITTEGQLYTCGYNNWGQLGTGDKISRNHFDRVELSNLIIDTVSVTSAHTLLVTTRGQVYACGYNKYGQLGLKQSDLPDLTLINYLPLVRTVSTRFGVTGVITETGQLYMCGRGDEGQLGTGQFIESLDEFVHILTDTSIKSISASNLNTAVVDDSNELYMCGYNGSSQFGVDQPQGSTYFIQIDSEIESVALSSESDYTIILTINEQIYATGQNSFGQLGLGDTQKRRQFTEVTLSD